MKALVDSILESQRPPERMKTRRTRCGPPEQELKSATQALEIEGHEFRQMAQSTTTIKDSAATTGGLLCVGGTHYHKYQIGPQAEEMSDSAIQDSVAAPPREPPFISSRSSAARRRPIPSHRFNSHEPGQTMPSSPFAHFVTYCKEKSDGIDMKYRKMLAKYRRWLDGYFKKGSRRWQHRSNFDWIRQQIVDSRRIFLSTSWWLITCLSSAQSKGPAADGSRLTTCEQLASSLINRETTLDDIESFVTELCTKFQTLKGKPNDFGNPITQFNTFTERDVIDLTSFETIAEQLIKSMYSLEKPEVLAATPNDFKVGLKKLCIRGFASAGLYECLSRACPVPDHASCGHTAHLSLQLDADEMGKLRLHRKVTTKCHMAIKSTVKKDGSHIWLKVVSLVDRNQLDKAGAEQAMPLFSPGAPAPGSLQATLAESEIKTSGSRKRRRTSASTHERPSKLTQTGFRGRSGSEGSNQHLPVLTSDIQICMEYLAQDAGDDLVVMKMTDRFASQHRIYYLPPGERPTCQENGKEGKPFTLQYLLWQFKQDTDLICQYGGVNWVIHIARLVAEAMLRFDRLTPNQRCTKDNIIFYTRNAPDGLIELDPFLEVNIETRESATNNGRDAASDAQHLSQGRSQTLLNLALIFLELALQEELELDPGFILERSEDVVYQVNDIYADVVHNCVNLYFEEKEEDEDGNVIEGKENDVMFREKYYLLIVHPLKQLDDAMNSASL